MTILIIISILVLLLTGLLVLPIRIVLDTERKKYFIDIPIYFRAQLVPDNQLFSLKIKLFYIPIKFSSAKKKRSKGARKNVKKNKRTRRPGVNKKIQLLMDVLSSFTIKKADIDIDTGDYPLNAQLIPVTQMINNENVHLTVNFENRNYADIEIFNRLYKLAWIGIKNFLITK